MSMTRFFLLIFIPLVLIGCKKKEEAIYSGHSFNLHTLTKTNQNPTDTNITFTWDGVATNTIFTVCTKNTAFTNHCEPIGSVNGVNTASFPLISLIRQHNAPFFIMAKSGAGLAFSNEVHLPMPNLVNALVAWLVSEHPNQNGQFGWSVDMSDDGNKVVIGSPYVTLSTIDSNGQIIRHERAGVAYVFERNQGIWLLNASLQGEHIMADRQFGMSVSMDANGKTVAVGAPNEVSYNPLGLAERKGAVHIFAYNDVNWLETARIIPEISDVGDRFGETVAMEEQGNTIAVSAPGESSNSTDTGVNATDNSIANAGAVYIFSGSGISWSQRAFLKAQHPKAEQRFGKSLAFSGNGIALAVGFPTESSNAFGINPPSTNNELAVNSGAVYLYKLLVGQWIFETQFKASNAESEDQFGYSVALDKTGYKLVVGAPYEDSCSQGINSDGLNNRSLNSGAAYVFEYVPRTDEWLEVDLLKGTRINAEDNFGKSVALNHAGDKLFVSAPRNTSVCQGLNGDMNSNGPDALGAVFSYRWDQNHWISDMFFKSISPSADGAFGESLAIDALGERMIISQPYSDTLGPDLTPSVYDSGAVAIF